MPRRARTAPRRAPRQKRSEDTILVLMDATERVVAKVGFHAATTNQIAKIAGVSIGTLYHYFPTKEALVAAVVHRMWESELVAVMQHGERFASGPLSEAIFHAIDALAKVVAAKVDLYRAWYSEASHLGELSHGLSMSNTAIDFVAAALEHRRAEIGPTDLHFAADLVVKTALAMVRTAARDWEKELASGALARELATMLTRYLVR